MAGLFEKNDLAQKINQAGQVPPAKLSAGFRKDFGAGQPQPQPGLFQQLIQSVISPADLKKLGNVRSRQGALPTFERRKPRRRR